jgi:Glycosyl transferase family 11
VLERWFRPRDAIAVRLEGGLGNQMFQYAAGRAVASRLGCRLVLDTTGLHAKGLRTFRPFGLHRFRIEAEVDTLPRRALRACTPVPEPSHTHAAGLLEAVQPGSRLQGYWQSERYFVHERAALLREFTLREPLDAAAQALAARIGQAAQATSVHVRRGDYVSDPHAAAFHGQCSLEYYRTALQRLRQRHGALQLFVFSDDPAWVREQFPFDDEAEVVQPRPEAPEIDIALMSLCRHHVLANSSFSWWGAWLATRVGDRLAPARWFAAAAGLDDRDMVPPGWERL